MLRVVLRFTSLAEVSPIDMVRLAVNSPRDETTTPLTKPNMPQIAWNDLVPLPDQPELQTPVKPTDADQELVMTVRIMHPPTED